MSLGGFTSVVRLTDRTIYGAFSRTKGGFHVAAQLEFEGHLSTFHYEDLRERINSSSRTRVIATVDFADRVIPEVVDEESVYIGEIRLWDRRVDRFHDSDETEIDARVTATLPICMLQHVVAMSDREIVLETTHDLVAADARREHLVARVRGVQFRATSQSES